MLKALMLRQIMMEDRRKVFDAKANDWKSVNHKFKAYLDDAVEFVNKGGFLRARLQA